jgi:hypothetical protein
MMGNGDYFIRCGLGRKGRQWSQGLTPTDCVLASEWEKLREAAFTTEHAQYNTSDLAGRMVGEAFLERVIGDPRVQAAGQWLCLERPNFSPLFLEGKFPTVVPRRQLSGPARHRPAYANVGYAEVKERLRGLQRGTLSNSDQPLAIFPPARPLSCLVWDTKWPLFLDANELRRIFLSQYSINANCQDDLLENPICYAGKTLADRHQAFFDLVGTGHLVAEGTFRGTGQLVQIPDQQWYRRNRHLEVLSSDLCDKQGEVASVMWESVTLRRSNRQAIAGPKAADVTVPHPTRASPPSGSTEDSASKVSQPAKRGRTAMVSWRVEEAMKRDLNEGRLTRESLAKMLEKHMEAIYRASRDSCRKARNKVMSELNSRQIATNGNCPGRSNSAGGILMV